MTYTGGVQWLLNEMGPKDGPLGLIVLAENLGVFKVVSEK